MLGDRHTAGQICIRQKNFDEKHSGQTLVCETHCLTKEAFISLKYILNNLKCIINFASVLCRNNDVFVFRDINTIKVNITCT